MYRALFVVALGIAAGASSAQAVTSDQKPVTVMVTTPEHAFYPQVIRLPAGRPVRIVVRNPSGIDHDLHAPVFFAKAKIDDADAGKIYDGELQVPKHSVASVCLIPVPGHYEISSTKPLDVATGMKGEILAY